MQVFDLPDPNFRPLSLAFSPDGRLLAGWSRGQVLVLDALSGADRGRAGQLGATTNEAPGIGFTADCRTVVAYHSTTTPPVQMHPLDPDATAHSCPKDHGFALVVGRTGEFAYLTRDSANQFQIVRWNPLTGKIHPGPFGQGYLRLLAVSADEKWVAGARGSAVRVWGFSSPKPPARATRQFKAANGNDVQALALSSDGAFVAFRGFGVWFGAVRDGKAWTIAEATGHHGRDLAFHPARPVLAYTAGRPEVVFYDVAARSELKRFAWGIGLPLAVAFSPDGLRCAAASKGKVVVWDVEL